MGTDLYRCKIESNKKAAAVPADALLRRDGDDLRAVTVLVQETYPDAGLISEYDGEVACGSFTLRVLVDAGAFSAEALESWKPVPIAEQLLYGLTVDKAGKKKIRITAYIEARHAKALRSGKTFDSRAFVDAAAQWSIPFPTVPAAFARSAEREATMAVKYDDETLLAYATWLDKHRDPRGELIRAQKVRAERTGTLSTPRSRQEQRLLAQVLGPLGPLVERGALSIRWALGFFLDVDVGEEAFDSLGQVLAHPCALRLHSLTLRGTGESAQAAIDAIAAAAPANLSMLHLYVDGVDLSGLWPRLANVSGLTLAYRPSSVGRLALPNLGWLRLYNTRGWRKGPWAAALAGAELPKLGSFEVTYDDAGPGKDAPTAKQLRPLLAASQWTTGEVFPEIEAELERIHADVRAQHGW